MSRMTRSLGGGCAEDPEAGAFIGFHTDPDSSSGEDAPRQHTGPLLLGIYCLLFIYKHIVLEREWRSLFSIFAHLLRCLNIALTNIMSETNAIIFAKTNRHYRCRNKPILSRQMPNGTVAAETHRHYRCAKQTALTAEKPTNSHYLC